MTYINIVQFSGMFEGGTATYPPKADQPTAEK